MRYFVHAFIAACLMSLVGCASANEASGDSADKPGSDECIFFSTLYDWRVLDDASMVLWAPGKRDAYLVELSLPLMGLRFADTLAFIDGNEDHRLCSFGRDAVGTNEGGLPGKSSIRSITRLNASSLAKLSEKYQVDLSRDKKKKKIPTEPARETAQ